MARHRDTPRQFFYEDADADAGEVVPQDWDDRYDPLAELRSPSTIPTPTAWAKPGEPKPRRSLGQRLARQWPLWSLGLLAAVMGVGVASAISLFRLPNLPNCRAMFWPTASATTRMQCAEAFADQGTVEGYLESIALLESLPEDHPLRGEISQRIEASADGILNLAERAFQAGQLSEAIAMARRIPHHTAAAQVVSDRVGEWNDIWDEAEALYAAAEADLANLEFQDAFSKAIQLRSVRNDYWRTTQYDELTAKITTAREDLNRLGEAKRLASQGNLAAMREALAIAQGISPDSPLYAEAQRVMRGFGDDLLAMAETALEAKDAAGARQILDAIPPELNLSAQIVDFRTLIDASQLAWQGGVIGLEGGIVRLQSMGRDRPLYGKAQTLMRRWQSEVDGRTQLEWARQVAMPNTTADLRAAIDEAQKISQSNPVWSEAEGQISRWRSQIETTEDRPILEEARQFARLGDLNNAIAAARRIAPGRALHGEAQELARGWRNDIERAEDGPILAEAQQLANLGRLQEAITLASRIGQGRALHGQAQGNIQTWRSQVQGQQQLQRAYQLAQRGTASALVEAIQAAQEVPANSQERLEATQVLNRWSFDLLRLAEAESRLNPSRAIEIAASVPPQTEAYAQAQLRLREWRISPEPAPIAPGLTTDL